MFFLLISRLTLKLNHLGSETRSQGQRKHCEHSIGQIYDVIIMDFTQNVCLDDFYIRFKLDHLR